MLCDGECKGIYEMKEECKLIRGKMIAWSNGVKKVTNTLIFTFSNMVLNMVLNVVLNLVLKGNTQFVEKVTFEPLTDFKQNHY